MVYFLGFQHNATLSYRSFQIQWMKHWGWSLRCTVVMRLHDWTWTHFLHLYTWIISVISQDLLTYDSCSFVLVRSLNIQVRGCFLFILLYVGRVVDGARMPTHSDTELKTENRNGSKANETRRYKSKAGCVFRTIQYSCSVTFIELEFNKC